MKNNQDERILSRVNRRKKGHPIIKMIISIIVLVVLIVVTLVTIGAQTHNSTTDSKDTPKDAFVDIGKTASSKETKASSHETLPKKPTQNNQTQSSTATPTHSSTTSHTQTPSSSSSTPSSVSETDADSTQSSSVVVTPPTDSSSTETTTPETGQQSEAEFATVHAGQGAYRVAINSGLSIAALQDLNPTKDLHNLKPGEQLRIR